MCLWGISAWKYGGIGELMYAIIDNVYYVHG